MFVLLVGVLLDVQSLCLVYVIQIFNSPIINPLNAVTTIWRVRNLSHFFVLKKYLMLT